MLSMDTLTVDTGFPDPIPMFFDSAGGGLPGTSGAQQRTMIPYLNGGTQEPNSNLPAPTIQAPQLDPTQAAIVLWDVVPTSTAGQYLFTIQAYNAVPPPVGTHLGFKARTGVPMIQIYSSNYCLVQDVRITRYSGNPIRSYKSTNNATIERVTINRPDTYFNSNNEAPFLSGSDGGIQMDMEQTGCTVDSCYLLGTGDDGIGIFSSDTLIIPTPSPEYIVTNVHVTNNLVMDSEDHGLLINASTGSNTSWNTCTGNFFVRNNLEPVEIDSNTATGDQTVSYWKITGNNIYQPGVYPALMVGALVPTTYLHNNLQFLQNDIWEASKVWHVFEADYAQNVTFSGNIIRSFTQADESNDFQPTNGTAMVYVDSTSNTVTGAGNMCLDKNSTQLPTQIAGTGSSISFNNYVDPNYVTDPTVVVPADAIAPDDGFITQAGPNSLTGGSVNATATGGTAIRAGYNSAACHFISVLSFNTKLTLPPAAIPSSAQLQLYGNVYNLNDLNETAMSVEIAPLVGNNSFFGNEALETSDYNATSTGTVATVLQSAFPTQSVTPIYIPISSTGLSSIAVGGVTQFRLSDPGPSPLPSNTGAYVEFFSGESATQAPSLQITYH